MKEEARKGKNKVMVDTFNFLQFFGWALILNLMVLSLIFNYVNHPTSDKLLSATVFALKAVQLLQVGEILFALFKISRTPVFASFAQVVGRLITVMIFLTYREDVWTVAMFTLPWSISDSIRSLYYLSKDSKLIADLRYNLFIFLYPIGVTGEILLMETRLKRDGLNDYYFFIRLIQVALIVGVFILYNHMLIMRKKFYDAIETEKKTN